MLASSHSLSIRECRRTGCGGSDRLCRTSDRPRPPAGDSPVWWPPAGRAARPNACLVLPARAARPATTQLSTRARDMALKQGRTGRTVRRRPPGQRAAAMEFRRRGAHTHTHTQTGHPNPRMDASPIDRLFLSYFVRYLAPLTARRPPAGDGGGGGGSADKLRYPRVSHIGFPFGHWINVKTRHRGQS